MTVVCGSERSYKRGCRCDPCREARNATSRRYRKKARDRFRAGTIASVPHGTYYAYAYLGCMCVPCRAVGSERNRRDYQRRKAKVQVPA